MDHTQALKAQGKKGTPGSRWTKDTKVKLTYFTILFWQKSMLIIHRMILICESFSAISISMDKSLKLNNVLSCNILSEGGKDWNSRKSE